LTAGVTYTASVRAVYPGSLYSDAKTKDFTTVAQQPTSLTKSDITSEGATFSWSKSTYGVETQYQWKVGTGSWSAPLATNVRTVTVTGLSPNTNYTFYVRSYYSETVQSSAISTSFTTECADNTLPWEYDFESDAAGSGKIPECWKAKTYTSGSVYPYVRDYTSYAHGGSKLLQFYGGSSTSQQSIVLPRFDRDLKDLTLSFYYNNTSTDADYASFQVGYYATDGDPSTAFTAVAELTRYNGYVLGEVDLKDFPTTKKRLVISYSNGSLGGHTAYIDDISLEVTPTCKKPIDLTCAGLSSTTATLSWTARNSETSWQIEYSEFSNFIISTTVDANSNPFTITDLTPSTTYYARVRAICSEEDMSGWCAIPVTFTTPCAEETLPFYENFNCLTSGIPECWDNSEGDMAGQSDNYRWNYYETGATGACVRFNSYNTTSGKYNFLKTRAVVLPASTAAKLTFQYKNGAGGNMTVYYSFDGGTTTTQLANLGTQASWAEKSYNIPSQGTAKNLTIVFKGTSNYGSGDAYLYIDDVRITASSCADNCTSLSNSSVEPNSAVLSWTSSASLWALRYRSDCGEWTEIDNITTKPYTLDGLDAKTRYEVQVKSVCGVGSEGAWSNSTSFTTPCFKETLPFYENFNCLTEGIPDCWDNSEGTTTTDSYKWTYYASGVTGAGLRFNSYINPNGYTNFLKTRTVVLPASTAATLTFQYKNGAGGNMTVYYSFDGGATTTQLADLGTQASWAEKSYTIPSQGTAKNLTIVFKGTSNYGSGDAYLYLDDVRITASSCTDNCTSLSNSSVGGSSAVLSWTSSASQWGLRYRSDCGEWTEVDNITTNPYTLSELDPGTNYEVQVKSVCGAGSEGAWSNSTSFTTTCDGIIHAIESHYGFEDIAVNSIPSCWTRTPDDSNIGVYSSIATANSGSKSLKLNGGYTERTIILPEFAIPFRDLKISLYCMIDYANPDYGKLQIGYINSSGTFVSKKTYTPTILFEEVEYEYPSDGYADTPQKIALQFSGASSESYERNLYIDDITVTVKPCTKPTANEPSEVSYTSATITWTDTRAEEWSVRYKKTADEDLDENWTEVNELTSKTYTMTGLDLNTEYEVQVRNDCYAESSPWTDSETFTTLNPVAEVSVGGEFDSYHMTVAAAITAANSLTNPTVTMLRDASVDSEVTISAAMTLDLNGATISSTEAAAKGVFKINALSKTFTINDSGEGGKISHVANYNGYLSGINLVAGTLNLESGTIYAENTSSSSGSSYRAMGIYYNANNTQAASVTISGGTVEAKRSKTYAYAICLYTQSNCGLTMTGGEVIASGTGNIRGIYTQGAATLSNVTVSASASGSANCYTIFSDKNGRFTINSGTYTATGSGTDVYPIAMTQYSDANPGGTATINGGRFTGKSKEVYVTGNGSITLQGGVYVHNTDLPSYVSSPYTVEATTAADKAIVGEDYLWKVGDFTNAFTDATDDHKWSTAANWTKGTLPTIETYATINKPCVVDMVDAQAKSVVIYNDGSTHTGHLVLDAGKELVVATTVKKTTDGSNSLATGVNDIEFSSTSALGLGALVMGSHDGTNKATVNFYTKSSGKKETNTSVAQYVGTPFNDETNILYNWYNSWVYRIIYNSGVIDWDRVNEGQGMNPFEGYCVFSADAWNNAEGHSYWMQGTLVSSSNHTCTGLNWQSGSGAANANNENLLANSWMAPIKIKAMQSSDFDNAEATIYIFNSTSSSAYTSLAGNYDTYTVGTCEETDLIPAMQSFSVFTTGSDASVTLDYNKIVYTPAVAGSATPTANYAPRRASASEDEADKMKLFVRTEDGYGDMLYMWERADFTEGFENGWDGRKLFGESYAPQLYAITPDGEMAVNCVPTFEGTVLGFRKGTEDDTYTFTFEYAGEGGWYLNDLREQTSTFITSDNIYPFAASDDDAARFIISRTPIHTVPTGITSGSGAGIEGRKLLINGILYIIRNGRMYDATGVVIR